MHHSLLIHSLIGESLCCFWFWLFTVQILQAFMCRFLCGHKFSAKLHLGVQLLGHMAQLSLALKEAAKMSSKVAVTASNE